MGIDGIIQPIVHNIIMKHSRALLSAYIPVLLWSVFIFLLSNQPTLPGPDLYAWDFLFKKSAHMFVYFVLFFLFFRALRIHYIARPRAALLAVALTLAYAATDEFHQTFVPGRTGTIKDLGFDALGILVGWLKLEKYV